jgi:hypothetical protein
MKLEVIIFSKTARLRKTNMYFSTMQNLNLKKDIKIKKGMNCEIGT